MYVEKTDVLLVMLKQKQSVKCAQPEYFAVARLPSR